MKKNIAVIGSGSWGVALGMLLNKNGHNVKMWSYNKEEARIINEERKCKFLPEITIPDEITCYTDFESARRDKKKTKYLFYVLKEWKQIHKWYIQKL